MRRYSIVLISYFSLMLSCWGETSNRDPLAPSYVFQPGDTLLMEVREYPALRQSVKIESDGNVKIPALTGKIHLAGAVNEVAQTEIVKALRHSGYRLAEDVKLQVVAYGDETAIVLGNIKTPGRIKVRAGDTVQDLIKRANGDRVPQNVRVILRRNNNVAELTQVFRDQNCPAMPGDIISIFE